ncbi:MAG: glycosyltransferase family 2 protein [Armatimonadetes bacterium]|nr:glycosyltransferase family 2 protein [Armatimonadota bacterium]
MKADWKNTAVIVPIYNSSKYLEELFRRIFYIFPAGSVYAINDASTDNSTEICKVSGVNLINVPINRGKGNALNVGFKEAITDGFKFAFSIDSDLQHKPENFPGFLEKQNKDEIDLLIGRRILSNRKMPFMRICSNSITSKIVSIITKQKILDSQCGFRLYNLDSIKGFKFRTKRYQFETEVILKLAKAGGKTGFIEIETIYDGQKSYISHLRDIKNFIKIVVYEIFH